MHGYYNVIFLLYLAHVTAHVVNMKLDFFANLKIFSFRNTIQLCERFEKTKILLVAITETF